MARFIREIMNPELFSVTSDAKAESVLDAILELGITAVPVLDEHRRPIGVTSIRDLVRKDKVSHISTPALAVSMNALIEDASRMMVDKNTHHLVVVGSDGCAVGMVSSLDLLRASLGVPMSYPPKFPHLDPDLDVAWSDRRLFELDQIKNHAPKSPGVIVLSISEPKHPDHDAWAEETPSIAARLLEMREMQARMRDGTGDNDPLWRTLARREHVQFRCAVVLEPAARERIVRRVRERIEHAPLYDRPLVG